MISEKIAEEDDDSFATFSDRFDSNKDNNITKKREERKKEPEIKIAIPNKETSSGLKKGSESVSHVSFLNEPSFERKHTSNNQRKGPLINIVSSLEGPNIS